MDHYRMMTTSILYLNMMLIHEIQELQLRIEMNFQCTIVVAFSAT